MKSKLWFNKYWPLFSWYPVMVLWSMSVVTLLSLIGGYKRDPTGWNDVLLKSTVDFLVLNQGQGEVFLLHSLGLASYLCLSILLVLNTCSVGKILIKLFKTTRSYND